jgi:hypothetical protein
MTRCQQELDDQDVGTKKLIVDASARPGEQ